jgi:ATP-dependent Lon protease
MQIGGVKEKLLAAVRAGIDTVVFPDKNEVDVDEVDEEIRKQVKTAYVSTIDEVFDVALIKDKEKPASKKPKKRAEAGARAQAVA